MHFFFLVKILLNAVPQESLKRIQNQNQQRTSTGGAVYGVTPFSDLSPDEFTERHLLKYQARQNLGKPPRLLKAIQIPEKFDWYVNCSLYGAYIFLNCI